MDRQDRQDPDYRESRADAAAQQEQRAHQAQKVAREHHEREDRGDHTALPQGPEVPRARQQGDEQLSAGQKEACARVLDGTQEQGEKAEAKAAEKHLGGEIHPSGEATKNPAHKTENDAHHRC